MLGFTTGLRFLSSGAPLVTGGSITVPDEPAPAPPTDPADTGDTGGGDPTPPPAPTLPALSLTPAARWHPAFSNVTLDGAQVVAATDIMGLADLSADLATAPEELTDGRGRPFWRFDGAQFLTVANSLQLDSQNMAVFFVGRFHRISIRSAIFTLGSESAGTAVNSNGAILEGRRNGGSMPLLQSGSRPSLGNYPNPDMMVVGSQMQVAGMSGRPAASGGAGIWLNQSHQNTTAPIFHTGVAGAEIGRNAYAPGTSGRWGTFDLYDLVVFDRSLSDAEGDTMAAEMMAAYDIPAIANQLVLEGDSIMQGTDAVTPGLSAGMVISAPGSGLIGEDWRVVNLAASGNEVPDLVTRRDTYLGWPSLTVPGRNVLAFEIGRNDLSPSYGSTPTMLYDGVVSYLTDAIAGTTQSILATGWETRVMANIASGSAFAEPIETYRALLRDPAFTVALGTDAGGPFDGQMQIIPTDQITDGGNSIFADVADAIDSTYYAGDGTHPNVLGARLRATGGDDPAKGIADGLI